MFRKASQKVKVMCYLARFAKTGISARPCQGDCKRDITVRVATAPTTYTAVIDRCTLHRLVNTPTNPDTVLFGSDHK